MNLSQYTQSLEFQHVKAFLAYLPIVALILDNEGYVFYENNKALDLSSALGIKDQGENKKLRYGDFIQCRYVSEKNHRCGNSDYCGYCELQRAFTNSKSDYQTVEFVREVIRHGELIVKWFRATIVPFESFKLLYLEEKEISD